ncbi:hypothetical protein J2T17_001516 [Paenibacillus mucilaginosus]|uniref:lysophospholipid acyltransferase family protein n=1 Tax=Paenibacillus mucilaginosus TaxID=61624 RepID=UPI003D244093
MMSEEGLRRFRFFRRLGAFSVDRGSLQGVKDSLRYAAGVLEGERRALWLFPQGDIRHGDVHPLGFHSGIGYLLREVPGIQVVPVSFYYCFLQDQKPGRSPTSVLRFLRNGSRPPPRASSLPGLWKTP